MRRIDLRLRSIGQRQFTVAEEVSPMCTCIRIEYTIKPDVDLNEVRMAITSFVEAIATHHPDHRYTSFQSIKEPRDFTHVGELRDEAVDDLLTRPFFKEFSEFIRPKCSFGPEAVRLTQVASTQTT
jgi:quinol monooxygenase YgiN